MLAGVQAAQRGAGYDAMLLHPKHSNHWRLFRDAADTVGAQVGTVIGAARCGDLSAGPGAGSAAHHGAAAVVRDGRGRWRQRCGDRMVFACRADQPGVVAALPNSIARSAALLEATGFAVIEPMHPIREVWHLVAHTTRPPGSWWRVRPRRPTSEALG